MALQVTGGSAPQSLGDIGGDGHRCPSQLIGKRESLPAREPVCELVDRGG